ncbi:hypothetical protein Tco_0556906, partial [Tanacetum coccineum]
VQIYQKSQDNRQKRANTDTRNGRAQKKPKIQKQSQEKSTLSQLKSKKVNLGSNTKCHITDCHTFNPCEIESHPTAQDDSQMIDEMIGQDSKERVQQGTA